MQNQVHTLVDSAVESLIRFRNGHEYADYQNFAAASQSVALETDRPFLEVTQYVTSQADLRQAEQLAGITR